MNETSPSLFVATVSLCVLVWTQTVGSLRTRVVLTYTSEFLQEPLAWLWSEACTRRGCLWVRQLLQRMRPCYRFLVHCLHSVSMSACKCDVLKHRLTQPPYLHYRMFELGGAFRLCTAYTLCDDYRYTVLTKTKLPNWNLPTRIGDQSAKLYFHRIFRYVPVYLVLNSICPALKGVEPQGLWRL